MVVAPELKVEVLRVVLPRASWKKPLLTPTSPVAWVTFGKKPRRSSGAGEVWGCTATPPQPASTARAARAASGSRIIGPSPRGRGRRAARHRPVAGRPAPRRAARAGAGSG